MARPAPSPLWGRGWGEGWFWIRNLPSRYPHPCPSPTRGEGTLWRRLRLHRFSCAVVAAGCKLCQHRFRPNSRRPRAQQRVTIGYVEIAGDPRHEPIKAYERLVLKPRESPFAGAQVGIDEAQALSRVLKIDFALERITVKSAEEVAPAVTQARGVTSISSSSTRRPKHSGHWQQPCEGRDVLLFNATAPDDSLRRDLCAREIVHTLPSLAMTSDALMQYPCRRASGATCWCCRARCRPMPRP